jgi:hypothetical protein
MTWGRFQLAAECAPKCLWKSREKCTENKAIPASEQEKVLGIRKIAAIAIPADRVQNVN